MDVVVNGLIVLATVAVGVVILQTHTLELLSSEFELYNHLEIDRYTTFVSSPITQPFFELET